MKLAGLMKHMGVVARPSILAIWFAVHFLALRSTAMFLLWFPARMTYKPYEDLPDSNRSRLEQIALPSGLMATDDCNNLDYEKELGQYVVEETLNVEVIMLAVLDDLTVGVNRDGDQYELLSWRLHDMAIFSAKNILKDLECAEQTARFDFHCTLCRGDAKGQDRR